MPVAGFDFFGGFLAAIGLDRLADIRPIGELSFFVSLLIKTLSAHFDSSSLGHNAPWLFNNPPHYLHHTIKPLRFEIQEATTATLEVAAR